jgi:hypothetical protein
MIDPSSFKRLAGAGLALMLVWAWGPASTLGQQHVQDEDPEQTPDGLRFTPGMARAFAGLYTREVLKERYQMPEDKTEQAREMVARRFMQLAHNIDEPGRELIERFAEEQLTFQAAGKGNEGRFMPPAFGKEFADRLLPIMPEIRDMMRGVSQDVRPMLPFKQQLKMAGDMMAVKTGIDGFEETMKKWSSGEITDYKDPFNRRREQPKKDDQGQTERLKGARNAAQNQADKGRAEQWGKYLEKFKELYGLDAAQVSTAESTLREYTEREERLRSDTVWRDRIYQSQLWTNMCWELEEAWNHPAKWLIEDEQAQARESWNDLEEQFKARLESIPTSAQRRAAEQRVTALLKEKGLSLPETQP